MIKISTFNFIINVNPNLARAQTGLFNTPLFVIKPNFMGGA